MKRKTINVNRETSGFSPFTFHKEKIKGIMFIITLVLLIPVFLIADFIDSMKLSYKNFTNVIASGAKQSQ